MRMPRIASNNVTMGGAHCFINNVTFRKETILHIIVFEIDIQEAGL